MAFAEGLIRFGFHIIDYFSMKNSSKIGDLDEGFKMMRQHRVIHSFQHPFMVQFPKEVQVTSQTITLRKILKFDSGAFAKAVRVKDLQACVNVIQQFTGGNASKERVISNFLICLLGKKVPYQYKNLIFLTTQHLRGIHISYLSPFRIKKFDNPYLKGYEEKYLFIQLRKKARIGVHAAAFKIFQIYWLDSRDHQHDRVAAMSYLFYAAVMGNIPARKVKSYIDTFQASGMADSRMLRLVISRLNPYVHDLLLSL